MVKSKLIKISENVKKELDKKKVVPRDTYNDVINRLLKNGSNKTI